MASGLACHPGGGDGAPLDGPGQAIEGPVGIAGEEPRPEPLVIGGQPSALARDAVVLVTVTPSPGSAPGFCGGTLVAPNVVATALHCIAQYRLGPFVCAANGQTRTLDDASGFVTGIFDSSLIDVFVGDFAANPTTTPTPDAGVTRVVRGEGEHLCDGDIAFLILDRDLDVSPVPVRVNAPPVEGEMVTVVGYGGTDPDALGAQIARNERGGIPVERVMPAQADPNSSEEGFGPGQFTTPAVTCQSDSGGAALAASGALLGVTSLFVGPPSSNGFCATELSVFVQAFAFASLLEEAMAAAGQAVWREGEPRPGSVAEREACVRDDNCANGICTFSSEGDETGLCAALCQVDGDCFDGEVCRFAEGDPEGQCELAAPDDVAGCSVATQPTLPRPTTWWPGAAMLFGGFGWLRRRRRRRAMPPS